MISDQLSMIIGDEMFKNYLKITLRNIMISNINYYYNISFIFK